MVAKPPPLARDIFLQAVEQHSPEQWSSFLDTACGLDDKLRSKVERLLKAHGKLGSFMSEPVAQPTTSDHAASPSLAREAGRYKLLGKLGEGGMGVVYVAEQTEPVRRRVALKLIKPGMDSRQIVARFSAERQALALMDHPNIARVLDGGSTKQGRPYFVMELVQGPPITDYCDVQQLTIQQRLELFVQVCRAVQHAHTKGIIHRDLKPSNVLVARQEDAPVPKVIDFGVAKAIGQSLTDETIYTQSAQVLGTPMYMSPEQAAGGQADIDTRSDVYSLGVLLYELLTGTTPFDPDTLRRDGFDELRRLIREQEPPQPSQRLSTLAAEASTTVSQHRGLEAGRLRKLLRGELDWIVMKALEKDRARRYQSAADLAEDIQRHLEHRPVEASPPSTWYRLRKYVRRNRAAIAVSSTIVLVLLAATGVSSWQAYDAHRARGQAVNNLNTANTARNDADRQRKRAEASYKKARDTIKELLEKVAKEDVAVIPGMRELHLKLIDDAVRAYGDLIAIDPNDAQNYYDRASLLEWRRDPNFFEDAEKAVELDPNNTEYLSLLGGQLIWKRSTPGDLNRALSLLDRVVALDPDNGEVVAARAHAYIRLDRPADARRELERLRHLPKASAGAVAGAAMIAQDLGDDKLALSYLQRALTLGPTEPWCHVMRGRVLSAQGQTDAAIEAFSEAIRLDRYLNAKSHQWHDAHYFRAKAYERKGMQAEAIADLLEVNPQNSWTYASRGELHMRLNKYAEALADFNASLELNPDAYHIYKRRARTNFNLKNYAEALADLRTAYKLKPSDTSTLIWINPPVAVTCPDDAFVDGLIELAKNDPSALKWFYRERAFVRHQRGRLEEAFTDLTKCAELDMKDLSWRESQAAQFMEDGPLGERFRALVERIVSASQQERDLRKQAWEQRRTELGATNAATLDALGNLIDVCDPVSPEYVTYLEELYEGHRSTNSDSVTIARAVHRRAEKAAPTSRKALEYVDEFIQSDGARHDPNDARGRQIRNNLGCLYNMHRDAKAIAIFEPIVELERTAETDPLNSCITRKNLAVAYAFAKRYEEATKLWREVLDNIDALPEAHREPTKMDCYRDLADTYEEWGKLEDATVMWLRYLEMLEKLDGPEHVAIAGALASVGKVLVKQDRFTDAEPLLRRCLEIREAQIPDDWRRYNAMCLLGAALSGQQKFDEAKPLLVDGFAGLEQRKDKVPQESLIHLSAAAEYMARFYEATGEPQQAKSWRDKAAELKPAE